MQLTFCCSYLEETAPPETPCSDCCSVELDTSVTLFANRLVSAGRIYRCHLSCAYLSKYSFLFKHVTEHFLSLSGTLLAELREYNLEQQRRAQADSHSPDAPPEDSSISARLKGKMTSRLDSNDSGLPSGCQHTAHYLWACSRDWSTNSV